MGLFDRIKSAISTVSSAMAKNGLSVDAYGNLVVNKYEFNRAIEKNPDLIIPDGCTCIPDDVFEDVDGKFFIRSVTFLGNNGIINSDKVNIVAFSVFFDPFANGLFIFLALLVKILHDDVAP